jgi:hypothetical protein
MKNTKTMKFHVDTGHEHMYIDGTVANATQNNPLGEGN